MEIQYDTDGLTDQCPIWEDMNFDDCVGCFYFRGYMGFIVFCKAYEKEKIKKEEIK